MGRTTRATMKGKSIENEDELREDRVNLNLSECEGKEIEIVEDPPIGPFGMYFQPEEYNIKIKIPTRCYIYEVVETLKGLPNPLTNAEERWFREHPSFKHIWHFPMGKKKFTHSVMAMWMLILRTIKIEKENEVWFMVNGVPIRYGLKEHALISGFDCRNYPFGYMKAGSEDFAKRCFNHLENKPIRYEDVREKLLHMDGLERNRDRLKMAVLYLLAGVIRAQSKTGVDATPVEGFLLRAVDDLEFCEKFPWGRYTFDHVLEEIKYMIEQFQGTVSKAAWTLPGFIIPLELLAFEAIPKLGNIFRENVNFREDVSRGDEKCPRMCKTRFKKGYYNGFSLEKVTEELGSTQEIDSILPIREEEESLMDEITEEDNYDRFDLVVDNWMRFFSRGKVVKFDHLDHREREPTVPAAEAPRKEETVGDVMDLLKSIDEKIKKLVEKVDGIEQRLTSVVDEVMEVKEKVREGKVKEKVNEEVEDVTLMKEGVKEVREKSKVRRPSPEAGQGRITRSKTIPSNVPTNVVPS